MDRTFTNFLAALRGVDVRVSVAETLDALETAELVGWQDRAMLKDALSMALAKTQDEKQAFEDCFDQFFRADSFRGGQDREEDAEQDGDTEKGASPEVPDSPLLQMVKDQDDAALAVAMQEAAREVGVENIKYFTQRGLYTQRILQAMGVEAVDSAISAMEREGSEGGGGSAPACSSRCATSSSSSCRCSAAPPRPNCARTGCAARDWAISTAATRSR